MKSLFKGLAVLSSLTLPNMAAGGEYPLNGYMSFTKHGDHFFDVTLPQQGIKEETVLLEVELGCAEVGCSDWDYTVRFQWQTDDETFELGRLITPYAGFMQRNMMGFDRNWRRKYLFDVSHLSPVLKGEGKLVAHYGGWGAKRSAFGFSAKLVGKGAQSTGEVKRVIPVYESGSEGWGYKDADHFAAFLPAKDIALAPDETRAELKMIVSAHGHALSKDNDKGEPELCGEWCDRYFDVFKDGEQLYRQQLWRDNCDLSATHPQAGTYIFSRANWCPGEIVEPFTYPLDLTNDNLSLDIDWQRYSWEPSPWGNTAPRYIVSAYLVTYGAKQRVTDLALEQILSPNAALDLRNTQSCGQAEIVITNKGQTQINDATIVYGIKGGNQQSYQWSGELAAGMSTQVVLPGFNWGMFDADNAEFFVRVQTNGDEAGQNDTLTSKIDKPIMLNKGSLLALTLDKAPQDTRIDILDRQGNVVQQFDNLDGTTVHQLPLDLNKGCYTLAIHDSGHDGLFNHFTRNRQGRGAAVLLDGDNEIVLEPDFGRLLNVPFTYDYPLGQCKESTWQTGRAYNVPGELVSHKGIVYKARHWSYNFEPDKSGPWDAWEAVMHCDGTAL